MGDLVIWLLDKSNTTTILLVVALFVVEFLLDIAHDLVLDWIHKKRGKK